MKFHFCGDLEAPDWLLAEMEIMSKMSSIRIRLLCREVLQQLFGRNMNHEMVSRLSNMKHIQLSIADLKAIIAAIHYIFLGAAKNNLEEKVLSIELQQIGLPSDIVRAICGNYSSNKDQLRVRLTAQSLQLPRLKFLDWRLDYILSSSHIKNVKETSIRMNMRLSKSTGTHEVSFDMVPEKFSILHSELKSAKMIMNQL